MLKLAFVQSDYATRISPNTCHTPQQLVNLYQQFWDNRPAQGQRFEDHFNIHIDGIKETDCPHTTTENSFRDLSPVAVKTDQKTHRHWRPLGAST